MKAGRTISTSGLPEMFVCSLLQLSQPKNAAQHEPFQLSANTFEKERMVAEKHRHK